MKAPTGAVREACIMQLPPWVQQELAVKTAMIEALRTWNDGSCIDRARLETWTDRDFESHTEAVRHTIKRLIDAVDAALVPQLELETKHD